MEPAIVNVTPWRLRFPVTLTQPALSGVQDFAEPRAATGQSCHGMATALFGQGKPTAPAESCGRSDKSASAGQSPKTALAVRPTPSYINEAPASARGLRSPLVKQTCAVIP
jgi:hypothetical protein